jgi:hypothetical protein
MFFNVENDPDLTEKEAEAGKESSQPPASGEMASHLWRQEFKKLPIMVRVLVGLKAAEGKKKEEMVFVFPLPNGKNHVIYK